jgi:hypothetical protein
MYLNAMRMRLMWVGAMVILVLFAVYWGGSAIFGPQTGISIEWGVEPDLVGSTVEVDGKPVGKLEKFGQATHTGFPVGTGKHTVRVVTEMFECRPFEVTLKRGERLHLCSTSRSSPAPREPLQPRAHLPVAGATGAGAILPPWRETSRRARERWEEKILKAEGSVPSERKATFETTSGFRIRRLYTPADLEDHDYIASDGFPGEYPFTRGVQSTMYRGRFWTMRQYAGFGTAEESNARYRYLLSQGQTGSSIAFDLPTQLGYDSDHDLARGEVGKVGVAIDSLRDMEILLADIPLDRVSTSMTINATATILLALYVAVAKRRGVDPAALSGTVQNDILKEYAARGNYIYPAGASMRSRPTSSSTARTAMPRWNPISISGYHIREAGSTAGAGGRVHARERIAYVEELRGAAWRSTPSCRASPSSSTRSRTSSRRSRSSARRAGCGRRS